MSISESKTIIEILRSREYTNGSTLELVREHYNSPYYEYGVIFHDEEKDSKSERWFRTKDKALSVYNAGLGEVP